MNWLILPQDRVNELNLINTQHEDRNISPVSTVDGVYLIGADIIEDSFWIDYQDFALSLVQYEGLPIFPDISC